jgi:membrane associated rhomboid family serine protease
VLSLIPISDVNPTRRFPIVTVALIAANVVIFFTEPGLGISDEATVFFYEHAPVPCQLVDKCPAASLIPDYNSLELVWAMIVSTFLHGGILHIAGNLLFLWVFGNNIEDHLGRGKFLTFYLLGGLAASFAHILWSLRDLPPTPPPLEACFAGVVSCGPYVPAVGASGAVAAVMGAYILLFPKARVNVLVPIFIIWTVVQMSALAVLGIWFVYQFLIGAQELSGATEVAWMAHVGGFVFGVAAILVLGGRPHPSQPHWQPDWRY